MYFTFNLSFTCLLKLLVLNLMAAGSGKDERLHHYSHALQRIQSLRRALSDHHIGFLPW